MLRHNKEFIYWMFWNWNYESMTFNILGGFTASFHVSVLSSFIVMRYNHWSLSIIRIWNHYTNMIIYVNDDIISLWTCIVSNVIKWVAHLSLLLVTPTHATTLLHNLGYLSFSTNAELILFVLVFEKVQNIDK